MSRSVVLRGSPRCPGCQLTLRWCICAGARPIETALQVDVLMHVMESYRPSSTGHLIGRVVRGARRHLWGREVPPPELAQVRMPDRELWVLHPQGEPMPAGADPARLQVLLLDGSWVQATAMSQSVTQWGRRVSLPMTGESRYWLRTQAGEGRFSTIEALLFLLEALGQQTAAAELRAQFELHVYASLRSRGAKDRAEEYLNGSVIREKFPEVLAQLDQRRPNLTPPPAP